MVPVFKSTKLFLALIFLFLSSSTLYAEQTRIMPLGDSITKGVWYYDDRPSSHITGYRSFLWNNLANANYSAEFVGSLTNGEAFIDGNHEGHSGWDSHEIAAETYSFIVQGQPDIVLLHIGTNDRGDYNSNGVESILNEIQAYEDNTGQSIKVYVALIIDREDIDYHIYEFNTNLHQLIGNRILNGDNIVLVDMYSNINLTSNDYADNTHPNNTGYSKMADIWFAELMKPSNPALNAFPYTIVEGRHIKSLKTNSDSTTIEFTVQVPDTGITF